jgi:nucleoside-diphosphate-sugar epimerase
VHAVARSRLPGDHSITWHERDLLTEGEPERLVREIAPTHLFHLAWFAVPGEFWSSSENLRWVRASACLVHAFAANGGRRMVAAGTCAEYDWTRGLCVERETPLAPTTLYGESKNALREQIERAAAESDMAAAWGRIFFVYGPREHPARLVSSVACSLLSGREALCSHGEQVRDFVHAADVASAFVQLLDSDATGPVNIASGTPTRIRDLVELIAAKVGRPELVRFGALTPTADQPAVVLADIRRLREEVGWRQRISLEEGVEQTVDWWRARLRLA